MNKYEDTDPIEEFASKQTENIRPRHTPKPKSYCDQMRTVGRGVVPCEAVIGPRSNICPKEREHYIDPRTQSA